MASIGIIRSVDGTATSATATYLTIVNSVGAILVASALVTPTAAGVYSYDITTLTPGSYTAQWTFQTTGLADDVISRPFTVDSPAAVYRGLTLADIERRVARRVGPFFQHRVASSSSNHVQINRLRSSLAIGDYEDMFILRRGVHRDGTLVQNFPEDDRLRIIESYESATGRLSPDYPWALAPEVNEVIELHALDPEQELRPSVVEGLGRCYFKDIVSIDTTAIVRNINLTDLAPWITRREQVLGVEYQQPGSIVIPQRIDWYDSYTQGGSTYLKIVLPYLGSMKVSVLRPHTSFVNGETSFVGPDNDNDVLNLDTEYAVLAGWLHCWINHPSRLQPLATQGLQMSPQDISKAFATRSRAICPPEPEFIQNRFGGSYLEELQVGNL